MNQGRENRLEQTTNTIYRFMSLAFRLSLSFYRNLLPNDDYARRLCAELSSSRAIRERVRCVLESIRGFAWHVQVRVALGGLAPR